MSRSAQRARATAGSCSAPKVYADGDTDEQGPEDGPEVDVLDGLTTAIVVDQRRMSADPRSTVGTATDANAMPRVLFSRLGKPHVGSPQAFSFNVASISGAGAVTLERGGRTVRERRSFISRGSTSPTPA